MRPPECEVCDRRFDPGVDGDLVAFERDPADADWYLRAASPLFVGHPPHEGWFCADHLGPARSLAARGQTLKAAMRELALVRLALATGSAPLQAGQLRVLCLGDGVVPWCHDFASLSEARAYADDVAAEAEHGPLTTLVTDGAAIVARGRGYAG